jgi:predicted transcriptional regulator
MNITKIEEKILKKIGETKVTTKIELKSIFSNPENTTIIDSATKGLIEKELIASINPLGSTCFIITRKGNQLLKDMCI